MGRQALVMVLAIATEGRNSEFCVTVSYITAGPVTGTAGILTLGHMLA